MCRPTLGAIQGVRWKRKPNTLSKRFRRNAVTRNGTSGAVSKVSGQTPGNIYVNHTALWHPNFAKEKSLET